MDTVVLVIVCALAVYGALSLLLVITGLIRSKICLEKGKAELVLMVKDQEENIEAIIRGLHSEKAIGRAMPEVNFSVVDMGSGDGTLAILERLQKDYGYFEIFQEDQKEKIFSNFEE